MHRHLERIARENLARYSPDLDVQFVEAPEGGRAAIVAEHHADMLEHYGAELGLRCARKHLGWYMDRAGTSPGLRKHLLTAPPREVRSALRPALLGQERRAA